MSRHRHAAPENSPARTPPVPTPGATTAGNTPASAAPVTSNPAGVNEDMIRARAHALWEQAGRPDGDGAQFWLEAERELVLPR